jgi:hypothetical protein
MHFLDVQSTHWIFFWHGRGTRDITVMTLASTNNKNKTQQISMLLALLELYVDAVLVQ